MALKDPRRVLNAEYVNTTPACFNCDKQYQEYERLRFDTIKHDNRPKDMNFCLDCTPEYQKKMMIERRCEHPETRFLMVELNEGWGYELLGISARSKLDLKNVSFGVIAKNEQPSKGS